MIKRVGADLRSTFEVAFGLSPARAPSCARGGRVDQASIVRSLPARVEAVFDSMLRLYEGEEEGEQRGDHLREAAQMLVDVKAPYLVRYVFVRDLLRDPAQFSAVAPILEGRDYVLHWGGSHEHRMAQIIPRFDGGGLAFVDIGCGPGAHLVAIAPRYPFAVGYEKVRAVREIASRRLERECLFHIELHGAFHAHAIPFEADVLITEVLQHMPFETASELLGAVLRQRPRRVVVTVPNRAFNQHYGAAGEFRHADHDWEPDLAQFESFVLGAAKGLPVKVQLCGLGDLAHGVPSSLLAQLEF